MILTVTDVAEVTAGLRIADRQHIYCGKMQDKKDCCIGIYNLNRSGEPREVVGGDENSSYREKRVSFLVHWNKSISKTEETADALYRKVKEIRNVTVNHKRILFTRMLTDAPVDVGTDDAGIYEMVIEAVFYYERNEV